MASTSQQRAVKSYRKRLGKRGIARFEVVGRKGDRELIRTLAKRLAEEGADAARLRAEVSRSLSGSSTRKGGVLAALLRAPSGLADVEFDRPVMRERKLDL
jgi:hypothetical protein